MLFDNPARYGDLKTFRIIVDSEDISASVVWVDLHQSIFSPTWSCEVMVNDTNNNIMGIPIKLFSKIEITVETFNESEKTDDLKTFKFRIHKIYNRLMENTMQQSYTMSCIAEQLFIDQTSRKVCESFSDQSHSGVVANITTEYLKSSCSVPYGSSGNLHAIIPNWSPFNAISWLSKSALYNNSADYLFFQTDTKQFAFKPFEQMYSNKAESCNVTFTVRPKDYRVNSEYVDDYTMTIGNYQFNHYDGLTSLAGGLIGSKTQTYDFTNKEWKSKDFKYGEDNPKDKINTQLWNEIVQGDVSESSITFVPIWEGKTESDRDMSFTADKWVGSRKSSIQKMDVDKLTIQCAGGIGAWKWIGKNCIVELPSQQDMIEEELDKYFKGSYVIAEITHKINRASYMTNFMLIKKQID